MIWSLGQDTSQVATLKPTKLGWRQEVCFISALSLHAWRQEVGMLLGRGKLALLRQRAGCSLLARCLARIHQGKPLVGTAMAASKNKDNTTEMESRAVLGCCLHQRSKSLLPC